MYYNCYYNVWVEEAGTGVPEFTSTGAEAIDIRHNSSSFSRSPPPKRENTANISPPTYFGLVSHINLTIINNLIINIAELQRTPWDSYAYTYHCSQPRNQTDFSK